MTTSNHDPDRARAARFLALAATALLTACSGNVASTGATPDPDPDPTPVPGAAALRATLVDEGITALPAPPAVAAELVELGRALFFDKLLSGNHDVSCATCHWPELGGADARALPQGVGGSGLGTDRRFGEIIPRHSPTVLNAHLATELFWDGRVARRPNGDLDTPAGAALTPAMRSVFTPGLEVLAAQAMFPPTSREEMRGAAGSNELADLGDADFAGIWDGLVDRILGYPAYQNLMQAAYPGTSLAEIGFAHAANAIAAFEATAFARTDSPFEQFVRGDDTALTEAEIDGAREFFGPANCASCHAGNAFTDEGYHAIGLPQFGPGKGHGGAGDDDFGREGVTGAADDRYRFRTPTLLNVAVTAPFGHAGQFATLEAIVAHYRNPADSLERYDIAAHVDDAELLGTLVANTAAVRAAIDRRLRPAPRFDAGAVVTFLRALTDPTAGDASELVPTAVPSGLPVR